MIDGRRGRPANAGTNEFSSAKAPPSSENVTTIRARLARIALGRRLARRGVTADQVTLAGLVLAAATGAVIALGHLWVGVALVTTGGLMDTLDGAVAKAAGSSSRRGAFFDSVADRVADAFMFGGLAWYLSAHKTPGLALLPFGILAVGNVVSYERAKAESFGWDARGGLMERAERLIFLGVALAFNVVLVPLLWALLGLCVVTAVQRFVKIWRQATAEITGEPVPAPSPVLAAWRPARVESRWREWREARATGVTARRPASSRAYRARRRSEEPLATRLRSVLAAERSPRGGRTARPRSAGPRAARRQRGTASALGRRFGASR